jgi:HD superfamily phosphohydrolase
MYSNVYWHRVVRIATAMIKRPLNMAMEEGKLNPADLYWLDDEEFFGRFSADRFRPYRLIGDVSSRRLYKTVYEAPYNEELHGKFLPLPSRLAESERIASALSNRLGRSVKPWEVIIDIPEPISFEIDLPIVDRGETLPFAQSGTVFSKPVVEGFTNSMRMLRIFAPESRARDIRGVIEELV